MRERIQHTQLLKSPYLWLCLILLLAAVLRFSRLGEYHNTYYTATVVSMLQSPSNFLFGSFDPVGIVTVDKPPASFWLQAIFARLLGVHIWSITLPQVLLGILNVGLMGFFLRQRFGFIAGLSASLCLAVLPATVIIDTRNEPDALLATTSFLAAIAIMRAVKTSTWRWLLIFSLLISIGFNTKMLVAFVPLPAFFLYYVLAARYSTRTIMLRCAVTATAVFILSGLWISIVALTPSTERPYIGSTPDNSIFTLVFEYNGLDRFTSFIGPRFRGQQQVPGNITPFGQPISSVAARDQVSTSMPTRNSLAGVWGLFTGALAEQLGWLLLVVLLLVPLAVFYFYPRGHGIHPFDILRTVRGSPQMSELVLWTAWLGIGCVVFGLARSTTTHPYYLVGIAIPLSASLGIGVSAIMHIFARGTKFSWIILGGLIGGLIYQVTLAGNLVSDWVLVPVVFLGFASAIVLAIGLRTQFQASVMSRLAFCILASLYLIMPLNRAMNAGERIVNIPNNLPQVQQNSNFVSQRILQDNVLFLIEIFRDEMLDHQGLMLATLRARDAAPFIMRGIPAIAIGGFSGNDPIFSSDSFALKVRETSLRYFFISSQAPPQPMQRQDRQRDVVNLVQRDWIDVSQSVLLPRGTLYLNPDMATE